MASLPEAYGLSELHVAAITGDFRRAREILKSLPVSQEGKKKILEARDREGSTALMTAVLCGRLRIAKLLLRYGASRKTRDFQSRVASEYSRSSLFNVKLKIYQKLGLGSISGSQQRKISVILRNPAALRSCRRFGNHPFSYSRMLKHSKRVIILKPSGETERFKPGKEGSNLSNATAGFITSAVTSEGTTKVEQLAVSGWNPNPGRGPRVLDNAVFTGLVREVIRLHDLKVCGSQRDNGNQTALPEHKGRFAACHVEKKLALWWVLRVLKKILGTSDVARISDLRGAVIPTHFKEARLFLDHGPCRDVSTLRNR
ncbi:hypothetical protein QBC40DRAFT_173783 [Triangularia verruculosa]|uniref:Single-strand DNA deaminase toxin A-like C-terminal domain-containing protein n=1 Tax=Triangularia verruculosa TaxID=2587418 RepID=A0AAN7AVC1_9PEZI|nr:hypothetical protein QBC40DRAFT_173783 [Triangularia verruculosa]